MQNKAEKNNLIPINGELGIYKNGLIDVLRSVNNQANTAQIADFFPLGIANEIREAERNGAIYPNYLAVSYLFAVSVASGNRIRYQIQKNYTTAPVLWVCLVGTPGYGKSFHFDLPLKPLFERQNESFKAYAMQSKTDSEAVFKQLIVNDFTIEAISKVLTYNPNGIGVYNDELNGLFQSFGRYSGGGGNVEQEYLKSAFSQKPITINRKKDAPIYIHEPFVSIGGTTQPSVLKTWIKNNRESDGFNDRWLFCYENDLRVFKKDPFKEYSIDIPRMYDSLRFIMDIGESYTIEAKAHAREILTHYQNTVQDQKIADPEFASILEKIGGTYLHRFALLYEIIGASVNKEFPKVIGEQSAQSAVNLAEYFIHQARRARDLMTAGEFESLNTWQANLFDYLPERFTTGEALTHAKTLEIPNVSPGSVRIYVERFLKKKGLFKKTGHGKWTKV